jgi:hypothetical protein
MTNAVGRCGVVIFVSLFGIGPVEGKLPNAPSLNVKLSSLRSSDPRMLPLNEGSRLVLNSAISHFDFSTSSVATRSVRLLAMPS